MRIITKISLKIRLFHKKLLGKFHTVTGIKGINAVTCNVIQVFTYSTCSFFSSKRLCNSFFTIDNKVLKFILLCIAVDCFCL